MGEKEREEKVTRSIVSGSFFVRVNHQLQLNSSFCSTCHKLYRKDIYRGWLAIERGDGEKSDRQLEFVCPLYRSADLWLFFSCHSTQHGSSFSQTRHPVSYSVLKKRGDPMCVYAGSQVSQ